MSESLITDAERVELEELRSAVREFRRDPKETRAQGFSGHKPCTCQLCLYTEARLEGYEDA